MTTSGWYGEAPDAEPALPAANFMLGMRADPSERGDPLARARLAVDKPDEVLDPDERAANLLSRGYRPGQSWALAQELDECQKQLQGEREKIAATATWEEHVRRMHEAGRITAFDVMRMLGGADEGDDSRVSQLEARARSLRSQIQQSAAASTRPQARDLDPAASALSRARDAHAEFITRTSAMLAGQSRPQARRPFVSRGAAGDAEPSCAGCVAAGATAEESFLIHQDPAPVQVPDDRREAEIGRLRAAGYSQATAEYAAVPAVRQFDTLGREVISR